MSGRTISSIVVNAHKDVLKYLSHAATKLVSRAKSWNLKTSIAVAKGRQEATGFGIANNGMRRLINSFISYPHSLFMYVAKSEILLMPSSSVCCLRIVSVYVLLNPKGLSHTRSKLC